MTTTPKILPEGGAFASEGFGHAAVDDVFAVMRSADRWDYSWRDLLPVQLEAMSERLVQRRQAVPALDQRADQFGIDIVERAEDAIPLMLSPATYKTYPEHFVSDGEWPRLLRWLDRLAAYDLTSVDVDGARDVDEFINRLDAAGFPILSTSGTSGKCSLLPQSRVDMGRSDETAIVTLGWSHDLSEHDPIPGFFLSKWGGPYRGSSVLKAVADTYVRPDALHILYDEPERVSELNRSTALARRISEGAATPSELQEARALQLEAERHTNECMNALLDELLAMDGERVLVWGTVYPSYLLVAAAARRGASYNAHPGTKVHVGGGTKNKSLPPTYWDDILGFYGPAHVKAGSYGQGEVIGIAPQCDLGRYHIPPTSLMLLLDATGEKPVEGTAGVVEGLLGVFDIAQDGRWGGLMSSDWLTVDLDGCPCGLRSPSVIECQRVDTREKDDKITCAGRAEMYVRGVN